MNRQEKVFYDQINATTSCVVDNVKNEIKKRKKRTHGNTEIRVDA